MISNYFNMRKDVHNLVPFVDNQLPKDEYNYTTVSGNLHTGKLHSHWTEWLAINLRIPHCTIQRVYWSWEIVTLRNSIFIIATGPMMTKWLCLGSHVRNMNIPLFPIGTDTYNSYKCPLSPATLDDNVVAEIYVYIQNINVLKVEENNLKSHRDYRVYYKTVLWVIDSKR